MAVFPDRIVFKNSTDSDAQIRAAIGLGGADQIQQGEVVLGLASGVASFYTLDSNGSVVEIVSGGNSTVSGVSSVNYFSGDVLLTGSDLTDVRYSGDPLFDDVTVFVPGRGPEGSVPSEAYGSEPGIVQQSIGVECVPAPILSYGSSTKIANGVYRRTGNQLSLGLDTWSIEIKVNIPDLTQDAYFLWDGVDETVDKNILFWWDSTNSRIVFEYYDSDTSTVREVSLSTFSFTANNWTYLDVRAFRGGSNHILRLAARDYATGSASSATASVTASTTVGARTSNSFNIGAVTLNGSIDRASTFFFQDFRVTEGSSRGNVSPIPESQYGPSTFQTHGVIQAEGDVLRYNSTDDAWDAAGNYGRAIVDSFAPTTDPSGRALLEGQFWFNPSSSSLYQYNSSAWVAVSSGGGGGSGGLVFWGGGDFTTGTSDGEPADGGEFTV